MIYKCATCGWEGEGDDGFGTHACHPRGPDSAGRYPSLFEQLQGTIGFQAGALTGSSAFIARIAELEAQLKEQSSKLEERSNQLAEMAYRCKAALDERDSLASRLDEIMKVIRHCAGESSFDSCNYRATSTPYCTECQQHEHDGHAELCWRRFAFDEPAVESQVANFPPDTPSVTANLGDPAPDLDIGKIDVQIDE